MPRSGQLDRAMVGLTLAASRSVLWLVIAGLLARLGGRRGKVAAERGLVSVAATSLTVNGPIKLLTSRRRPQTRRRPLVRMPRSSSFPSGHAASAFAFAIAASAELPGLAPALVPLAGAVGYSRVHVGVHYPSDVLAGAAIGAGIGALSGPLTARLTRRLGSEPDQPARRLVSRGITQRE